MFTVMAEIQLAPNILRCANWHCDSAVQTLGIKIKRLEMAIHRFISYSTAAPQYRQWEKGRTSYKPNSARSRSLFNVSANRTIPPKSTHADSVSSPAEPRSFAARVVAPCANVPGLERLSLLANFRFYQRLQSFL
ncbi:hypothetical protein, partial [Sphaerotilus sp.]|uniref:hypothetical protein n=1 Tax=Sphaerotilus sp. TaxID=2093942 RepID=UPI002ACEDDE2